MYKNWDNYLCNYHVSMYPMQPYFFERIYKGLSRYITYASFTEVNTDAE